MLRRKPRTFGQETTAAVVTVYGADEITTIGVGRMNAVAAMGMAGLSGTVRWEEPGFEGYAETSQSFVGAASLFPGRGGVVVRTPMELDSLPGTTAPDQFSSPMQGLLGSLP